MRKASKVLGIIGGALAIVMAIASILIFNATMNNFDNFSGFTDDAMGERFFDSIIDMAHTMLLAGVIAGCIGGILGIIGGLLVKSKNVLAGVFMLIGGVLSLFTSYGFIAFILLLLSGIFALVKDNSQPQLQPQPKPASATD